jgi:hypothetical protein
MPTAAIRGSVDTPQHALAIAFGKASGLPRDNQGEVSHPDCRATAVFMLS